MTLSDLLDEERKAHPEADAAELTRRVLDAALSDDDVLDVLYPAVLRWVTAAERGRELRPASRNHARAVEKVAFSSGPDDPRTPDGIRPEPYVNPAQAAMQSLLATTVLVPGEGMVPWGALTPELHARRIAFLKDMKKAYTDGVNETVARHEAAITLLKKEKLPDLNAYYAQGGTLNPALAPAP